MKVVWTVNTSSGIWVRSEPNASSSAIKILNFGTSVIEEDNHTGTNGEVWIKHSDGWSCVKLSSGKFIMIAKEVEDTIVSDVEDTAKKEEEKDDKEDDDSTKINSDGTGSGYQPELDSLNIFGGTTQTIQDTIYSKIDNALGIFGLPYQWLPITDIRIDRSSELGSLGEVYAENIISNMPLLLITPGKASFMTKYSETEKKNILERLISNNMADTSLGDLLGREGRYYTFEATTPEYFKFFNPMARIAARYLELQDQTIDGKYLDEIEWSEYILPKIQSFADVGNMGAIPFYIESENSISESFSNSTTQSTLASTVNSVSDMGRELNFLLGYSANANAIKAMEDTDINANIENVQATISGLLGKNNFLNSLAGHLTTVASGGRLTFPEIWSDSSYGKSYDVTIKLTSPDADKLSLYLNILLPIFACVALVAPQSLTANPNGYMSPFLVRAIYKGIFCIDTGIITSMSISKGDEGKWTPDGIPTQAEISMTIKDLYQIMSVTSTELTDIKYSTLNNTSLMDFIASTCGVNIFQPEIGRMIDMWLVNTFGNKISDFVKVDMWLGIKTSIANLINNFFRTY